MTIATLIHRVHDRGIEMWEENGQLKLKAPKGALTDDIREQLIASKADILSFLRQVAPTNRVPPIRPIPRADVERLPLSFAQERLWFIHQLQPDSPGYNIPGAVRITGALDVDRLEQAHNLIIARHDILRTVFPSEDGVPRQRILNRLDFRLERINLSAHETDRVRQDKALEVGRAEAATPFDLAAGPLLRGKIVKLARHEHVLVLNMHHIISDAWSMGVLIREIGLAMDALEQGRNVDLPPLPIQYADYSLWQRKWLPESGLLDRQLGYWREKLAGAPEDVDLATDYPRPAGHTLAGATQAFTLDMALTGRLKSLATRHECSLFMVLLATFKVLLHRYTGQEDICVGSPIANRQYGETEGLIGMFVNAQVLRDQVKGEDDFITLLKRVRTTCLEAYQCQDAPFEKIVDALQPVRNLALNPMFQIMFILQNAPMGTLPDHIRPYPLDSGISKFDLTLALTESADGLAGSIEYKTALYNPQTVERLARHFIALCQAVTEAPDAEVGGLDYMSDVERRKLLVDFNQTQVEYPRDKCVHQLFVEQAAAHPQRTAVVSADQKLTYERLYDKSHTLALHLQALGVGPDGLVGVCAERSVDMIVGMLGILQAGGAYLPLDPHYPDDRLAQILHDSRTAVVLTQDGLKARLSGLASKASRLIALDGQWSEIGDNVAALKARNIKLRQETGPHHLAYVIYTSGSTGRPKGVEITHGGLLNLVRWHQRAYAVSATDRATQLVSPGFDPSALEIWPCLTAGASLHIPDDGVRLAPAALIRYLVDEGITLSLLPTPLAEAVLREPALASLSGVRAVLTGGDKLHRVASPLPFRLVNHYGPTEATVVSTCADVAAPAELDPPIGRPIDNVSAYVLDGQMRPVPVGVPGELYIGGAGLARGYLGRPELTAERFVPDPFRGDPGSRLYRTGDRVRHGADGSLEFLGRLDTQVKIRGFRIETGEIETRLDEHPEIRRSVVVAQGQGVDRRLVAFYLARDTQEDKRIDLAPDALRMHLQRSLPEYMVPAAFVSLEAIPLTPAGKVDRRALERRGVSLESSQAYLAPRNEMERQLVEIWAQVLNLAPDRIGVNDNFFALGGHSLLATLVTSRIRSRLGATLPVKALFECGTIAGLARAIESRPRTVRPEIRWDTPFRLLKVQHDNLRGDGRRSTIVPLAYRVADDVASDGLKRDLERLLEHPIFKLRIRRDGGEWVQYYDSRAGKVPLEVVEIPEGQAADTPLFMSFYDRYGTTIDLTTGPIVSCLLVEGRRERYVLMLLDHCISDPVTVITLLDVLELCGRDGGDLVAAFAQRPSLSLQEWVAALERRSREPDVLEQRRYWLDVLESAADRERRRIAAGEAGPRIEQEEWRIPAEIVRKADRSLREAKLASMEDVILSLFARSCMTSFQEDTLCLTHVYNTRQNAPTPLESDQALGWYSESYPLLLSNPDTEHIADVVDDICKQKREIEATRLGYTLLSHYNDDTRKDFVSGKLPGIYFNYQGRGDLPSSRGAAGAAFFGVFNAVSQRERTVDVERHPYWLSCISLIEDGGDLSVYFLYRSDRLSTERMKGMIRTFDDLWARYAQHVHR